MAQNVNDVIFGAHMQHAVIVEMYNKKLNNQVQRILRESDRDVQRIIKRGGNIDAVIRRTTRRVNEAYAKVERQVAREISKFAGNEAAFNNKLLKKQVGSALNTRPVLPQEVRKAVVGSKLDVGKNSRTFRRHITDLAKKETRQIQSGIRQALTRGLTEGQAVDFIYDNPKFPAPNRLTRSQVRTLVRTSLTDVQSQAALQSFKKNRRIIEKYKYSATLDDRTSAICQRLDGFIQPLDGGVRPPQHYNCRSVIVPVVKAFDEIPGKYKKSNVPKAKRSSINGQVPASTNYNEWLGGQSTAVQNSILGVLRAEVFREERISIKQMIAQDGRPLSVGAARRIDNDVIEGKAPSPFKQANTRNTGDIESVLLTNRQWKANSAQKEIDEFFLTQSKDRDSGFATIHERSVAGKDYFDPEAGLDRPSTSIGFERRVWDDQLASLREAVRVGAISKKDAEFIKAKANSLSTRNNGINIHQRTVVVRVLTKRFANNNGYSGRKAGQGSWAKDLEVKTEVTNINTWLKENLDSEARKIRGRYRPTKQTVRTELKDILDIRATNKALTRTEKQLVKASQDPKVIKNLDEVLQAQGIDTALLDLNEVSEKVYLTLARGRGRPAKAVAEDIGRAINDRLPVSDDLFGTAFEHVENIRIGAAVLDGTPNTIPFRLYTRNTEYIDGEFVDILIVETDNKVWNAYANALERKLKYSNQPVTPGKVAKFEVGDTLDSNGRKLISTQQKDTVFDSKLTQHQYDVLKQANEQTFLLDDDIFFALDDLATSNPALLTRGGFFDANRGELSDKWYRLKEAYEANKGRPIAYNHFLQPYGRMHVRASDLNYNGTGVNKALHKNAKTSTVKDSDVAYAQFRFEAAEYLGTRKIKGRRVSIDTVEGRADIFDSYKKRMKAYGEAVLNKDVDEMRVNARFLGDFKAKNQGGVIRASIEYARMERYFARNKTYRGYKSGYRVGQDATASGPQIVSMLIRDARLAKGTNVIPTVNSKGRQVKQSVYLDVFPEVSNSKVWLNNPVLKKLDPEEAIAIFKNPVMTTLYNVGRGTLNPARRTGILGQIRQALIDIDDQVFLANKLTDKDLISLANTVADAIDNNIPSLTNTTNFIDDLFTTMAKTKAGAEWTLPLTKQRFSFASRRSDNFDLGVRRSELVKTEFNVGGVKRTTFDEVILNEIDPIATGFKAPPTLVHSLDADIIQYMRLEAKKKGINLQSNHDSFWSNLADYPEVNQLYKDALIKIEQSDFFKNLIEDAVKRRALSSDQGLEFLKRLEGISPDDLGDYIDAFRTAQFPIS